MARPREFVSWPVRERVKVLTRERRERGPTQGSSTKPAPAGPSCKGQGWGGGGGGAPRARRQA
eukprot:2226268-Prymnesium_polylepis.1